MVPSDRVGPSSNDVLRGDWAPERPSLETLRLLARLSLYAYRAPPESVTLIRDLGFGYVQPIQEGSTQCYFVAQQDVAVIVFRGTDELRDWIINLSLVGAPWPPHSVHKGFFDAYNSVKPRVRRELDNAPEIQNIWLTGHSQGGALALLCAYDLSCVNRTIKGLVTFGQPTAAALPLLGRMDSHLESATLRLVHGQDIVPRLPPGYDHFGTCAWLVAGKLKLVPRPVNADRFMARPPLDVGGWETIPYDDIPMSEEEFNILRESLAEPDASRLYTARPDGPYRGQISFIRDHSMELYLQRLLQLPDDAQPEK